MKRRSVVLVCDEPDCDATLDTGTTRLPSVLKTATKAGWEVTIDAFGAYLGDDHCPDHFYEPVECGMCGNSFDTVVLFDAHRDTGCEARS